MVKYKELKFLVSEHKDGWAITAVRDDKKIMIGGAIKSEAEVDALLSNILIEKEYYRDKIDIQKLELVDQVETLKCYKTKYERLRKAVTLNSF